MFDSQNETIIYVAQLIRVSRLVVTGTWTQNFYDESKLYFFTKYSFNFEYVSGTSG